MIWDAYLILKTAGIAVFIFGGGLQAWRRGFPLAQALTVTACAALLGSVFSRVWFILQHAFGSEPYEPTTFVEAWNDSGSVLYGWVLGGSLVILVLCMAFRWKTIKFFDSVLPWLLVAQTLNRLGCFAGECCWGKPTSFFLHVWNSHELAEVHPVQLYEASFDVLLILLCIFKANKPGDRTFLYFAGYAAGRFFLEFLRGDNHPALLFFTVPQVTSLLIIALVWKLWSSKSFRAKHLSF